MDAISGVNVFVRASLMTIGTFLLIVVVGSGEEATAETRALTAALEGALPDEVVKVVDSEPSSWAATREVLRASVRWEEPNRLTATVVLSEGRAQTRRTVSFSREDDPEQRGRTIGYVLLSMLPVRSNASGPRPAPQSSVAKGIELAAHGSVALGLGTEGTPPSFGGGLEVGWSALRLLRLDWSFDLRGGNLRTARASTLWMASRWGVTWRRGRIGRRLALEPGVELGVAREIVTRLTGNDGDQVSRGAWTLVVALGLEATYWARPSVGLVAGLGLDFVTSRTRIVVEGEHVGNLERFRPVASLGVRARF